MSGGRFAPAAPDYPYSRISLNRLDWHLQTLNDARRSGTREPAALPIQNATKQEYSSRNAHGAARRKTLKTNFRPVALAALFCSENSCQAYGLEPESA